MSRFAILTVSERAAERVAEIVATANGAAQGIRVGVKNGGCAGMEYTVDLVTEPDAKDDRVDAGDHSVWIDPKAMLFLLGTKLDYEVTKLRSGFVFQNPNQTSACGCGESVTLVPAAMPA
ncbi:Fe-S cluster assembly scaffold SufA [Rhizobiaceae bacterium]|nr:Fe-S cluster assembly scaffold SufA [Rhizobiaceae bacterium]